MWVTFSTSVQAQDVNTVASSTSCGGPHAGLASDQWNTILLIEMKRTGCEIMTAFKKAWLFLKDEDAYKDLIDSILIDTQYGDTGPGGASSGDESQ